MAEIALTPEIMAQLAVMADEKGTSAEKLAEQAIQAYLREEARRIIAREMEAFRIMHPELLHKYPGQYVAIYQSQIVDHDKEQLTLLLRIEKKYPNMPVLIKQVMEKPEEIYNLRTPKFENRP